MARIAMLRSGVVMGMDMDIVDIQATAIVAITTMDIAAITDILATTDILPMAGITEDTAHTIRLIIEAIMAARMAATTTEVIMVDPGSGLASVTRVEEKRGSKRAGVEAA